MATEFNVNLPSVRQLQEVIRNQQVVEVKLTTGDSFSGRIQWQDPQAICVLVEGGSRLQVRHGAIAYIQES